MVLRIIGNKFRLFHLFRIGNFFFSRRKQREKTNLNSSNLHLKQYLTIFIQVKHKFYKEFFLFFYFFDLYVLNIRIKSTKLTKIDFP